MKVTIEWTKTTTVRFSTTIRTKGGIDVDDWDLDMLAEEIDEGLVSDDIEVVMSQAIDREDTYYVDPDYVEVISDDPPIMPDPLCTNP